MKHKFYVYIFKDGCAAVFIDEDKRNHVLYRYDESFEIDKDCRYFSGFYIRRINIKYHTWSKLIKKGTI